MSLRAILLATIMIAATMLLLAVGQAAYADLRNPLRAEIRTSWPPGTRTVADIAEYLLSPVGYRLLTAAPAPRESAQIAAMSVDPSAIPVRVLPIEDALLAAMGPGTRLIVDHEHKLVSFSYAEAVQ